MNTALREQTKIIVKKLKLYDALFKIIDSRRKKRRRAGFQKHGVECLSRVKEAFETIDKLFWLDYGTLLGAVREKDFIGHDLDLDIGTFYEKEKIEKLDEALVLNGLVKVKEFFNDGKVMEQTFSYKGADIDIFYYFMEDDRMYCHGFYSDKPIIPKEIEGANKYTGWKAIKVTASYTGFKRMLFKNIEFSVPKDTHLYLSENYGDTYMIKQENWDSFSQPPNIEKVNIGEVTQLWYLK